DDTIHELQSATLRDGNPYTRVDRCFKLIKILRAFDHIPGMHEFLSKHREKLIPYKVNVLRSTVKANFVFMGLLLVFPLVPLLVGWPPIIPLLMLLPTTVWGIVTFKARRDLIKAEAELAKINANG
ncbi:MAG: hypothetical protein AAF570_28755, partial [Bacteroidota bacterium]